VTTILLVDDEAAITDNLAPLLQRAGFSVVVARDGEEAISRLAAISPDLVVLDVLLPGMDGREVLRRVRQERRQVPIILLAQVGESGERTTALEEPPATAVVEVAGEEVPVPVAVRECEDDERSASETEPWKEHPASATNSSRRADDLITSPR
jgi:CheY-like chemotaxis protein